MSKLIGIWTAQELLVPSADAAGACNGTFAEASFKFFEICAAEQRCTVRGRRRQNAMWEPIPAAEWPSLTIDQIASKSEDELHEYSEASAHPRRSGRDYHANVWNDLRWDRDEIETLRPAFEHWSRYEKRASELALEIESLEERAPPDPAAALAQELKLAGLRQELSEVEAQRMITLEDREQADESGGAAQAPRNEQWFGARPTKGPQGVAVSEDRLLRRAPPNQERVNAWLRARVAGWPADKPTPTEPEDWDAARAEVGEGVRRAQIREAVEALANPSGWRKQGPR